MKISKVLNSMELLKAKPQNFEKLNNNTSKKDEINISNEAKSYQLVLKAINKVDKTRQEKIEMLTQQIKNGTYNISTEKIAEKILSGEM